MDPYLKDRMEEYLAGDLAGDDLARFERELEQDADAADLVLRFSETSSLFDAIRVESDDSPALTAGFYARVNQQIEEEKSEPFWAVFTQPFMMRRLAFASLMWLFALGALTLFSDQSTQHSTQLADMILKEQLPVEHYHVRMGPNLEQNRESMLAVMMTPGK